MIDRDSLVVDLAAVFRHADGAALTYTASTRTGAEAPVVLVRRGNTVVVRPNWGGAAEVTLSASADGSRASTSSTATTTVPDRIDARPVHSVTVEAGSGASRAGPSLGDLFRHLDGRPLAFTVASSAPGTVRAEIRADTVRLTPVAAGAATVTVTASDRGLTKTAALAVTVSVPCPAPPADAFDPLPFRAGQTVRFYVGEGESSDVAGFRIGTRFRGTATWHVREAVCAPDGGLRFRFDETIGGITLKDRIVDGAVVTDTTAVAETTTPYTVVVPVAGPLPTLGRFVGRVVYVPSGPRPRYVPRSTGEVAESWGQFRTSFSWALNADAAGLTRWRAGTGGHALGPYYGLSLDVVRLD